MSEVVFIQDDGFEEKTNVPKREHPVVQTEHKDDSANILEGLDEVSRKVFELMPIDKAMSADVLAAQGIDVGDAITALTMLEISGLISSLPGGLYIRK